MSTTKRGRASKAINNSPSDIMIRQTHIKYRRGWKTEAKHLHPSSCMCHYMQQSSLSCVCEERWRPLCWGISPCEHTVWTRPPVSLTTVQMHGWGRIFTRPQIPDPVFFPHTHRSSFSFLTLFFFFTSILVKRYIQRLKYAFDKNEELIYGRTFIIAHS